MPPLIEGPTTRIGVITFLLFAFAAAGCIPPDTAPTPLDTQEKGTATRIWAVPTGQQTTAVAQVPRDEKKTDEPPIPLEEWGQDYLTKTWGMKLESLNYEHNSSTGYWNYILLVKLTKDLSPEELKTAREAFRTADQPRPPTPTLAICFFDKDMVVLVKRVDFGIMGEVTGTRGDAFRLYVTANADGGKTIPPNAVRAEFRAAK